MISKFVLALPAAALTVLAVAAGMIANSESAEACRRVGQGHQFDCTTMSTPRPDRPNQQKR